MAYTTSPPHSYEKICLCVKYTRLVMIVKHTACCHQGYNKVGRVTIRMLKTSI
jgi:hypothetical protein